MSDLHSKTPYPRFIFRAWCWCAGEASVATGARLLVYLALMDALSPLWGWRK